MLYASFELTTLKNGFDMSHGQVASPPSGQQFA